MILKVIKSSSEGNAYALISEGGTLLLEAGAPFKEVLKAIDYNVANVVGCLVTHEHGDHAGHVSEYLSAGVEVFASQGTCREIAAKIKSAFKPQPLQFCGADGSYYDRQLGDFQVTPFRTKHDAAEAVGFYIWHPETRGILFATDTYYIKDTFADLGQVMIECNYSPEILTRNVEAKAYGMTWERAQRVRASHLSLPTCIKTLKANDLTRVNNIVLIHVSRTNGDGYYFKQEVERATGIPAQIARPGLQVQFNTNPF